MSYKSEESKVYQWLTPSWKETYVFRSEHNVGDIYSYMENINYFFDKDDIYLISSHKKGISSHQLSRDIHVSQKTAWYISDEHLQAYIDEACFRWNTRKASQVERFLDMFFMSIGLVRPNREFVLCKDD